ncbi:Deoxyribonuclease-2-alpha [Trichinella spiralis]|uniref:Deoxyribonuclease-2-alpha n=1 Tax=Trichinella spiralis TaxID=6334 RepID=A0A0V1ARE0_TRISP|nr:Deoxyribonuclease-2-alpha [Trichinella spiralis]
MCFHCFFSLIYRILKLQNVKIELAVVMQTGAWQDGAQALSSNNGHSFATALQHVVGNNANAKFLAYNNAPPGVPNLKTRSNSKGVILLATNADSAAWTVHTVPGFPAAKTGYSWPVAENARGHLLICLTIVKSQINAIAASLLLVQPLIHYNDIPKTETAAMPYFNKLAEGKIPTLPPFTSRLTIRTQSPGTPVTVHIYSKSESSKYEIYKKVIVKVLKKTIKVWSRRDSKLKGDCRGSQRHIRLIKSPAVVVDHNTNLEADITNWAVSDPGNIFCHIDKPYFKNQTREPAMAICIDNINIFTRFDAIAAQLEDSSCTDESDTYAAILYKAPGQATGKIIEATDAARDWQDGAQPLNNNAQHSFATALQHVVGDNPNVKFLAYNNAPPGVPSIKTKSNSKGIIILSIAPGTDSAAWIVHTVPGFPAAKTGYNWPLAENARGHLLICLTISESQINAIAASLLLVQPMVHYNDIPETETAAMPYFNKLAEGKIPTLPPFTSRQTIRTQSGAAAVTVHIYSKSETSKYGDNSAGDVLYRAITNDSFCLYDSLMPIRRRHHDRRNKEYCFDYAPPTEIANSATDIALIMDSSKIISDSLFEKEKELIKRLAEVVSGNNYNVHIAVIQYSMKFTKQYLPAYTVFNLDRIKDTENFSNLIDNIKQSNWLVNISDALRLCEMNVFNSLNRDRPHVPNFIILFVYGTTFVEDDLPHYWAYRIKNAGHHILVISTRAYNHESYNKLIEQHRYFQKSVATQPMLYFMLDQFSDMKKFSKLLLLRMFSIVNGTLPISLMTTTNSFSVSTFSNEEPSAEGISTAITNQHLNNEIDLHLLNETTLNATNLTLHINESISKEKPTVKSLESLESNLNENWNGFKNFNLNEISSEYSKSITVPNIVSFEKNTTQFTLVDEELKNISFKFENRTENSSEGVLRNVTAGTLDYTDTQNVFRKNVRKAPYWYLLFILPIFAACLLPFVIHLREKHWKLRKIGKKKEIDNDEDVDGDFLDAMHFSIDYRVLSLQGAISDVEESMLAWKEFVECESSNTFTEK